MNFESQSNILKNEKNSSSLSLLQFHKRKQSPLQCPKKKSSLKLLACSCFINQSNLLITKSEDQQESGEPGAVSFVFKRLLYQI